LIFKPIKLIKMEQGLYRQEFEHDSCGIGAIVDLSNEPSHETISGALYMLSNMEHRGGRGSDPKTGDGAGILIQVPHQFLKDITARSEINLPNPIFSSRCCIRLRKRRRY
jgi:glutamate synthase (NADPH/NADH) large chain